MDDCDSDCPLSPVHQRFVSSVAGIHQIHNSQADMQLSVARDGVLTTRMRAEGIRTQMYKIALCS